MSFFAVRADNVAVAAASSLKLHRSSAVVPDNLAWSSDLAEQVPEGNQIVDKEAGGRKDQCETARQHRDERKLALDGIGSGESSGFLVSTAACG